MFANVFNSDRILSLKKSAKSQKGGLKIKEPASFRHFDFVYGSVKTGRNIWNIFYWEYESPSLISFSLNFQVQ